MRKSRKNIKDYLPDSKFKDPLVNRFVNHMMKSGKKTIAYKIFYNSMEEIDKRGLEKPSIDIWKDAIKNITPHVEVRTLRRGGANIQVPVIISNNVKLTKAIKILISCARNRNEKTMVNRLASEIIAAYKEEGASIKKKESIHKMAEANKAFSHLMITNNSWQKT